MYYLHIWSITDPHLPNFIKELQTALSDKNHLSSELEIINSEHSKDIEIIQEKHRYELNVLKDRLLKYKDELDLVESERDNLEVMVEELKKQHIEDGQINLNVTVDNNVSLNAEKVNLLEAENDELADVVDRLKGELTDALKTKIDCEVCLSLYLLLNKFH